ncbi:TetR/AcrR family transcriptional regulator [Streptomyces cyaneofuscatus]|uniref:TetR/AcrR family transcriptional regulator n=1 Tax=Streptomyces cyaneofuscatus TaxID=66883 RepID=UPI00332E1527
MTERIEREGRRPSNQGPKAAARDIFAEHGLEAPLSAIARRAGVGQGVLYRHFPDRAALVSAVLKENVRHVEQAAEADDATLPRLLGVLTWLLVESAAFIGLLHLDRAGSRSDIRAHSSALSDRVQPVKPLPAGGDAGVADADLAGAQGEDGEKVIARRERVGQGGRLRQCAVTGGAGSGNAVRRCVGGRSLSR